MTDTQDCSGQPMTISGQTQIVGLIGWPVEHSVSPPMHNAAFRALGLDWCYVPLPVAPERVPEAIAGARALGLRGINITVPHKQVALPCVDELTPEARVIGAMNTLIIDGERLIGHNTDAPGFARALGEAGFDPQGCRALVLGAGGAARAIVYALASAGAEITILNRTPVKAHALADEFVAVNAQARLRGVALTSEVLGEVASSAQLVVNTTPLGMWPETDRCPWPARVCPTLSSAFCYDLVYNPRETRLMQLARSAGADASNGLGMLVHQGAESFVRWTGQQPPIDIMYAACEAALGG